MIEILLLGVGWIVGLSGVAAAAMESFLELRHRRQRPPRWPLLGLVLLPACELRCEVRRDPPESTGDVAALEDVRPAHHALQYDGEGPG